MVMDMVVVMVLVRDMVMVLAMVLDMDLARGDWSR
jgi:hypothetical protein